MPNIDAEDLKSVPVPDFNDAEKAELIGLARTAFMSLDHANMTISKAQTALLRAIQFDGEPKRIDTVSQL